MVTATESSISDSIFYDAAASIHLFLNKDLFIEFEPDVSDDRVILATHT